MALHWRPVGPETAQTYWQRRAAVALAVLVPLLILLSLLGGGDEERLSSTPSGRASAPVTSQPAPDASATPDASADPSASPDPSASASPSASPGGGCADADLRVSATADGESFPVGGDVPLELSITNVSDRPCQLDVGQAALELVVLSGQDRIWSSDDCAPGGRAEIVTLAPGQVESSRVTWSGGRSQAGCPSGLEQAEAGTYGVQARVGVRDVEGDRFVLR